MAEPPLNFSWIEKGKLAACGMPNKEHIGYLKQNGIKHIISLTQRKIDFCDLNHIEIPIQDFCPPTLDQIKLFIKTVDDANAKSESVVVHCLQGRGRTGTMIACYLIEQKNVTAQEALQEVRRLRPGSVETREQEQAIEEYFQYLKVSKNE